MRAENNTWQHYQDNKVEWLLEDPSRANLNGYMQAGVVAFLFGRGADGPTCFCDAARDGVTNPAPINGNNRVSLNADDDGGYWRERTAAYYSAGVMTLPGGGGTSPTNTPTRTPMPLVTNTPTRTPTATNTPTRTPTPTTVTGSQTVSFDDLSSPNRTLGGQYPSGVINWGTNSWYLSGPWRRFTTNSISFNGGTPRSASFGFVSPRRLVQLDAFNGGTGASTVSLGCDAQTPLQVTLAANELRTIATGWSGTCTNVTLGSTNGWNTNFDSLVLAATGQPVATSTPTPTPTRTLVPTSTPTPTATPTSGSTARTLTFNDLTAPNRTFSGQYPTGLVDWGTNAWYLSGPYGAFTTFSIGFNGAGPTSANLRLMTAQRLVQVDAYNGGSASSTITLACAGQSTVSRTLAARTQATIVTNWTAACSTVTVGSTNGWDTNFDNVVIQ
jgi:hypothetical protein